MKHDARSILAEFIGKLQKSHKARLAIAWLMLVFLAILVTHFAYDLFPKRDYLTISGGPILDNKHFLARRLQEEAEKQGLVLTIKPEPDSSAALEKLDSGELDLLFAQSSIQSTSTNINHVATIPPEVFHILVKPEIKELNDLKRKYINTGEKNSETQKIAREVLSFSGLAAGDNYTEMNYDAEALFRLQGDNLPDAVIMLAMAPSPIVEYLVKRKNYRLLEVPFPASLAKRYGWATGTSILSHLYSVIPAVPNGEIKTIGINIHLLTHQGAEPRAIYKLLKALYSPDLAVRSRVNFNEHEIIMDANYPIAKGTYDYMNRDKPVFSKELYAKLQSTFALVMSSASAVLVVVKWLRGEQLESTTDDGKFEQYVGDVAVLDQLISTYAAEENISKTKIQDLLRRLDTIKENAMVTLQDNNVKGTLLPQSLFTMIADTRARILSLNQR